MNINIPLGSRIARQLRLVLPSPVMTTPKTSVTMLQTDFLWRQILRTRRLLWIGLGVFLALAGRMAAQSVAKIDRGFLTSEARAWLEGHATELCVAPEANYPPFSFAEAGAWRGLSADVLRLVEAKLGAKLNILPPQNLDSILTRVQQGAPGIVTSVRETPERSQFLSFTEPYVSIPTVIIVRTDSTLGDWPKAFADKAVAVGKGYGVQKYLEQNFSYLKLTLVTDDLEGLRRLSFGEVDAVIMDVASASFFIGRDKITNLRVFGTFNFRYDLSFAVRKELPVLREILDKALRAIPEGDKQAVLNRWFSIETEPLAMLRAKYPNLAPTGLAIIAFLIVSGSVAWNIILRRKVTQRTRALEATAAYSRSLIEANVDPLVTISPEGKITDVNEATVAVTGVPRDQLIGADFSSYFTDPAKAREGYQRVFADGLVRDYPLSIRHASGRVTDVLYNARVYRDSQGHVLGVFAAARDITERKRIEDRLRASEESYRNQFVVNASMMLLIDPLSGAIVDANAAAVGFYGYPRERLLSMKITEINTLPVADVRGAMTSIRRNSGARFEFQHRLADGTVRAVEVSSSPIQTGERLLLHSIVFDTTERKQAEVAVAQAREHYQNLLETASDGIHILDAEGHLVEASPSFYRMLGYARDERPRLQVADWDLQWSATELKERIAALLRQSAVFETRHRRRDGRIIEVEVNGRGIEINGRTHLYASARDVTERKRTEEKVRQLAREQQIILENANIGISLIRDRKQVWINEKAVEIFRYPREELDGHSTRKLYPSQEAFEQLGQEAPLALVKGTGYETVQLLVRGDGVPIWVRYIGKAIDPADMSKGVLWLLEDITERKRTQEEVIENQRRLALAMDQAHLADWEMDAATRTFTFNDRFYALFGTTAEREGGYTMPAEVYAREFLPANDQHVVPDDIAKLLAGEIDDLQQEHRIRRRDGELRDIRVRITVVRDAGDRIVGTRGSNQDITESKRAQEALRSASIYARKLIEVNLDPLVTISPAGKITDVNEASVQATGMPREQLIGTDFSDYFTEPEKARDGYQKVFAEGMVRDYPLAIRHVSGRVTDVLYNATIYRDRQGLVLGVFASARDVTERIAQQREVEKLLKQTEQDARTKTELLREVNHRVTNNLSSILGLFVREQKAVEAADRPLVQPVLDRLTQRIRGLLTAHRLLSESSWAPVRVDKLAGKIIAAALSADPNRLPAQTVITPSPWEVSPRHASSLALVLNELTTNSIKHGRVKEKPLTISLEAGFESGFVTVCYRDNGPGFPAEVLAGTRSNIGQALIRQLVTESLQGDLALTNEAGATVRIRIRPEEPQRT